MHRFATRPQVNRKEFSESGETLKRACYSSASAENSALCEDEAPGPRKRPDGRKKELEKFVRIAKYGLEFKALLKTKVLIVKQSGSRKKVKNSLTRH